MTKTFLQLLAEIKALDAIVISASPTSLILATRKHTVAAADAYVAFLVKTLSARELHKWLLLQPSRAWLTLLWRDRFNYAGIAGHLQLAAVRAAEGVDGGPEDAEGVYEARWNLRDFLPPAMAKYFDDIIQRFVMRPWRAVNADAMHAVRFLRWRCSQISKASCWNCRHAALWSVSCCPWVASFSVLQEASQAAAQARDVQARCTEFLREWLPSNLLERMFQMTAAISRHVLVGASAPEAAFPQLPGSHLSPKELGTPALAFVRTVCHILALDTSVELEVSSATCVSHEKKVACMHAQRTSSQRHGQLGSKALLHASSTCGFRLSLHR
jgi:DNA polymerase epsilon subunit 1